MCNELFDKHPPIISVSLIIKTIERKNYDRTEKNVKVLCLFGIPPILYINCSNRTNSSTDRSKGATRGYAKLVGKETKFNIEGYIAIDEKRDLIKESRCNLTIFYIQTRSFPTHLLTLCAGLGVDTPYQFALVSFGGHFPGSRPNSAEISFQLSYLYVYPLEIELTHRGDKSPHYQPTNFTRTVLLKRDKVRSSAILRF